MKTLRAASGKEKSFLKEIVKHSVEIVSNCYIHVVNISLAVGALVEIKVPKSNKFAELRLINIVLMYKTVDGPSSTKYIFCVEPSGFHDKHPREDVLINLCDTEMFLDLWPAFGTIDRNSFLGKLEMIGVRGTIF